MNGPKNYTAEELFELLNETDECTWIEAKGGSCSSRAVMESVCSFSNEPNLGGGYILLGVAEDDSSSENAYKVVPLENSFDKFQADFASQCNDIFNIPVRPQVYLEKIHGHSVLKIRVKELSTRQKPLFFKSDKLPYGAMRRIGTADLHCSEEDMIVFYSDTVGYDLTPVSGATLDDVDENAMERYRLLRKQVNLQAEELFYSDRDLLAALGCINRDNPNELNLAGVLLFGTSMLQRRVCPMHRIDYIRVPGNEWIPNPDERFISIDMRGSLLLMLFRLIDAVNADLPKGFLLKEGEIQAKSLGLPLRVLREALVNAMTHRSYREYRPTQVIRYDNRIEITNSGYSLKPEDELGQPGSIVRNQIISTVFHETNLAENKGSGISVMQNLMRESHLALPTFESNHQGNTFTIRLLLHHFLGQEDLKWLAKFSMFSLNDAQKTALIFAREAGAVDNSTYRQMSGCDTLKASAELRTMKEMRLLDSKGKGRSTYYVLSSNFTIQDSVAMEQIPTVNQQPPTVNQQPLSVNQQVPTVNQQPLNDNGHPFSQELLNKIAQLKKREHNLNIIKDIILDLCSIQPMKVTEIAKILKRSEYYIRTKFLYSMISNGELQYLYPEMVNHPNQAYITARNKDRNKDRNKETKE